MELTLDPKITQLRDDMRKALRAAEAAAHAYWTECDIGDERTWGANICEIIRTAPRAAKENI